MKEKYLQWLVMSNTALFNNFLQRVNSIFVKRFKISKNIENSVLFRLHPLPALYFVELYL